MGLLKLPQKRIDGVEYIDQRSSLFYNKYRYRARVHIEGVTLLWYAKTETELLDRINKSRQYRNVDKAPLIKMLKFLDDFPKKNNNYSSRIEYRTAALFSNDLDFLKTLETVGAKVDYTEVDGTITEGTKYFVNEPKYKYRLYLKSKRVTDDFADKLADFIKRYEGTNTKMCPSNALNSWLKPIPKNTSRNSWGSWKRMFCSSQYFIDYNDESTLTLFMLVFDGMVSRKFKLEKRP